MFTFNTELAFFVLLRLLYYILSLKIVHQKTNKQKPKTTSQANKLSILPNLQQTKSLGKRLNSPQFNFNSITYLRHNFCACAMTF